MQTTSSGYGAVVNSSYRPLNTNVFISWNKTLVSGINFFTINTSTIAGNDIIKGSSDSVSFFDKYNYSDYTAQTKNWSVERRIGQFPFGLIMAQADVELDNSSKLFLPNYDATIGSGILPNRPLKIGVGFNNDNFLQFTGFTGQPELSIVNRNMLLHAYDVVDYINNYSFLSTSGTTFSGMLTNTTTASAINYYLGKLGFNSNQTRLDASLQDPIGFINVTDRKFGEVLKDLVEAEGGLLLSDETGIVNFWNRQHFNTTSGTGSKFSFNYNNIIDIRYSNAPIINDVTVRAKPRAVQVNQRVWVQGSSQTLLPGQSTTIFANFSDDDGELPLTTVVQPSYSATNTGTSYYSTNANSDGTGAALNSYVSLDSVFNFGTSYKMVFTNSYSSTIYLTNLELYGNPAKVINTIEQRSLDNDSIDKYGRNPANNGETLVIQNDYIQSNANALALGYILIAQYKAPNRHYEVEVFSNPALQIGDFGTLTLPETNETKSVWITSKIDKLSPEGNLTQSLGLEERSLFQYFTINQSIIGGSDIIAP